MTARVTLNGACGRMGRELVARLRDARTLQLHALWERSDHPDQGRDALATGIAVSAPWCGDPGDVIIDFTDPDGVDRLLDGWPAEGGPALVVGTTGLGPGLRKRLDGLGARVPVFYAANMSLGIHVLRKLARRAAELLDGDWDVELVEMHHSRKADAPSGTAVALVETLQDSWPEPLTPVYGRSGLCGPRKRGEMGVFAVRGGGVVGEHELIFAGAEEALRISHRAQNRGVFATGALKAAEWLVQQAPGSYGMDHLVGA
jgi:4-hydroxy-tetrahydrodipicolinate reductase